MVFGVGQFNYASHIWLRQILVAMATKICDFQHKIGYNSACAGDTPQMLAPTTVFSGSVNNAVSQTLLRRPVIRIYHGNENLEI